MIMPITSEAIKKRRALITGGAGYIGTSLAANLVTGGWEVTRLARRGTMFPSLSGVRTSNVEADICDPDVWLKTAKNMDVIVHLAAQTSTYITDNDPLADESVNVRPMIQLLETCRKENWRPFIVLASTVTVIGLSQQMPVREDHSYQPLTVYDLHKWMAEQYLKMYCRLGYARGTTLRLANVYGPGPTSRRTDRGVLNKMIRDALAGRPLTLYGTGEWLRDYIHVDDVVEAFIVALNHPDAVAGRHWIIATGESWRMRDAFALIADRVAHRTGLRVPVEHVDPPAELSPIEERNFVADISGFSAATGWRPRVTLKEGIDQTIEAFMSEKAAVV